MSWIYPEVVGCILVMKDDFVVIETLICVRDIPHRDDRLSEE